jgi:hypothetical protein
MKRRRGRSAADYFMAFVGLAILAFVVAVIVTSDSCRLRVSPDLGVQPRAPRPTATAPP